MLDRVPAHKVDRAIEGFRFFGREDVAVVLQRATEVEFEGGEVQHLQTQYWELVPDDTALVDMFKRHLAREPEQFAPLAPE